MCESTCKLLTEHTNLIIDVCNIVWEYTRHFCTTSVIIPISSGRVVNIPGSSPGYVLGYASCVATPTAFNDKIDSSEESYWEQFFSFPKDTIVLELYATIFPSVATGTVVLEILSCLTPDSSESFTSAADIQFVANAASSGIHSVSSGAIDVRVPQGGKILVRISTIGSSTFMGHVAGALHCNMLD